MFLRKQIQQRFDSTISIFNRDGIQIPENQLKAEYKTIRQYLLDNYSGPQDRVAIKLTKDYRYMLTMLACIEIGTTYIPMKHDYPMDRVEQIKEDSQFKILIDDVRMEEILSYKEVKTHQLPQINSDQEAYIIFTSGSTGRPKGVIIQRKALENFFIFISEHFPKITSKDKILQVTEFTFDISLTDVGLFLTKNVEVYFSQFTNNIFKLAYEVENYRISVLNTVPNNLNMFLTELVADRMDYQCLKHFFIAGSRFSYGLYQKCLKYFKRDVEVYNLYGPTEATVYSHYKRMTYQEPIDCVDGNVSIGEPLPNMKAHIIVDGRIAGPLEKGELYIGGIQLMKGYINNTEQTQKSLVNMNGETFYRSGDLAFRTEGHDYFIIGRADDTIKYRGYRINLMDIDSYICRIPYVQDSVTIAIPSEITDNQTLGFIILKEKKSVKEIKEDMSKLLLDYQIPEKIIFLDKYPTNISGKVCKKTLKEQYLQTLKGNA